MSDQTNIPDDPFDDSDAADDELVEVTLTTPRCGAAGGFDLEWLFLTWAWGAGYRDWTGGVRALARLLRGLERADLIERRTIRRAGEPTLHGFALTDSGKRALAALAGQRPPT